MSKSCYLLSLVFTHILLSNATTHHDVAVLIDALGSTLRFLHDHYDEINIDCLYGVVLAKSILQEATTCSGPLLKNLNTFIELSEEIYRKTLPFAETDSKWNFVKHIADPKLEVKPFEYQKGKVGAPSPRKEMVEALYSGRDDYYFQEGFSDFCLSVLINQTLDLRPKICELNPPCKSAMFTTKIDSHGYVTTHKLLFLQVFRQRKCNIRKEVLDVSINNLCSAIFSEVTSLNYFGYLGKFLDLFMEQSLLCGYEGFSDFLRHDWLMLILTAQSDSGCFKDSTARRSKRTINYWSNGCGDHTTGLGAAILALYLNYLLKVEYCPHKNQ